MGISGIGDALASPLAGDGVFAVCAGVGAGLHQRTGGTVYGEDRASAYHAGRYQLGYFGKYAGRGGGVAGLDGLAVCKKKIARREAQVEACNLKTSYFRRA